MLQRLTVLILTLCLAPAATLAQDGGVIEKIDCPEHQIDGLVTCYNANVHEDPDDPDSRVIPIRVMRLHANALMAQPDPLFVIPGGPGQSIIGQANLRNFFAGFFAGVREQRDVVFVDQRGTGGSNPLQLIPEDKFLFVNSATNVPPEWAASALGRLSRNADLTQYTTARAVDDLDFVRSVLGYAQINIYGTSYGTRVAQYYVKRYGRYVRSVTMKGVAPPETNIALVYGQNPQRAFDKLVSLCAADWLCADAYPDLDKKLRGVLERLDENPVAVEIDHPVTRERSPFTITRGNFAFGVRSQMMNAYAFARLPSLVEQAWSGDFSEWAPYLARVRAFYASGLYGGMLFSVVASEDLPRLTEEGIRADADGTFIGDALARSFAELDGFWPRGDAPADMFAPLVTDVPLLLVSGALDPATPPEGAESMLPHLGNARHVVFAGGAHSAANFDGLDAIVTEFIEEASTRNLDLGRAHSNKPVPFSIAD